MGRSFSNRSPGLLVGAMSVAAALAVMAILPHGPVVARAAPVDVVVQAPTLAPGTRAITVAAVGKAMFPADTFSVRLEVRSSLTSPEQVPLDLDATLDEVQSTLRAAGLPLAVPDESMPEVYQTFSDSGRVYSKRAFVVRAPTREVAEAAERLLKPMHNASQTTVSDRPAVTQVQLVTASSTLAADPESAKAEARKRALQTARTEAEQSAAALGMTLGPPLSIGKLTVIAVGYVVATEHGYQASGDVTFELREP